MIVTIDGPAGAGKSSAARALARRMGFDHLDTGAMYRAVTLAGLKTNCDFGDAAAVERLLAGLKLEMPPGRVMLNGADVTTAIRDPNVTEASGAVANCRRVREELVKMQRQIAAGRDIVCEGRDQGTVVFPDAPCKFFLTADPRARAQRRHQELVEQGATISLEEVLRTQTERDLRDAARAFAPMVPAPDARIIDSSRMDLNQVLDLMEQSVRQCASGRPTSGTKPST